MMMFDDKVGGWGWLNADVTLFNSSDRIFSFWKNGPELVCSL